MPAHDLTALSTAWPAIIDTVERETGTKCDRFRKAVFHDRNYTPSTENVPVQNPLYMTVPGIEAKPWWSIEDFDDPYRKHLGTLSSLQQTFVGEFQTNAPQIDFDGPARTGYFGTNAGWRIFPFLNEASEPVPLASRIFPETARLLGDMRADDLVAKCHFSVLKPGAKIAVHCGAVNYELRLHYGLNIPKGDIALKVGGEARPWQNGVASIFDDTFPHEVWNNTDQDRHILHCRLLHPGLSADERRATYRINDLMNTVLQTAKVG
ncbi:aspartyl/asparaginyl beta-hydroxylase domain-containing protein [Puniceibacterium sediminis]|uniref:Aspartyl/Asparaginyl beta-hydroxylase n=1 Tax=Puniceibacterium sediminis TaxID=1608407 RepID=A0A238YW39_9RHOB|nr:aspartyl/asparaginyl beta-hydroxylase domain-containing protein [Puniceibacterium sediminis]SNR75142.1 Aspartyl/Asparaginyl beta-hydroxylase [Puniceibacterium sediminis]